MKGIAKRSWALMSLLGVDGGFPVYDNYFDEAMLDEMMNDYFEEKAEEAA